MVAGEDEFAILPRGPLKLGGSFPDPRELCWQKTNRHTNLDTPKVCCSSCVLRLKVYVYLFLKYCVNLNQKHQPQSLKHFISSPSKNTHPQQHWQLIIHYLTVYGAVSYTINVLLIHVYSIFIFAIVSGSFETPPFSITWAKILDTPKKETNKNSLKKVRPQKEKDKHLFPSKLDSQLGFAWKKFQKSSPWQGGCSGDEFHGIPIRKKSP